MLNLRMRFAAQTKQTPFVSQSHQPCDSSSFLGQGIGANQDYGRANHERLYQRPGFATDVAASLPVLLGQAGTRQSQESQCSLPEVAEYPPEHAQYPYLEEDLSMLCSYEFGPEQSSYWEEPQAMPPCFFPSQASTAETSWPGCEAYDMVSCYDMPESHFSALALAMANAATMRSHKKPSDEPKMRDMCPCDDSTDASGHHDSSLSMSDCSSKVSDFDIEADREPPLPFGLLKNIKPAGEEIFYLPSDLFGVPDPGMSAS